MTAMNEAFIDALLADAVYVDGFVVGMTGVDLTNRVAGRMTPPLAKFIGDRRIKRVGGSKGSEAEVSPHFQVARHASRACDRKRSRARRKPVVVSHGIGSRIARVANVMTEISLRRLRPVDWKRRASWHCWALSPISRSIHAARWPIMRSNSNRPADRLRVSRSPIP